VHIHVFHRICKLVKVNKYKNYVLEKTKKKQIVSGAAAAETCRPAASFQTNRRQGPASLGNAL